MGKRACLWLQDFVLDLAEVRHRLATLRCRGVKGTTGTQASFLTLFQGDGAKVRELDRRVAAKLGFAESFPVTGQTYSAQAGQPGARRPSPASAETCHKFGTDLRLLQGVGELSEPFDAEQVGSSAMAYKRNPIRAERMCGLARRLITDSLNGPLNAATQWLERSLDDSANRRLVIPDSFLCADAILGLAAHIARRPRGARGDHRRPRRPRAAVHGDRDAADGGRAARRRPPAPPREDPRLQLRSPEPVETGGGNPLIGLIVGDPDFRLTREEVEPWLDPVAFTGRSAAAGGRISGRGRGARPGRDRGRRDRRAARLKGGLGSVGRAQAASGRRTIQAKFLC